MMLFARRKLRDAIKAGDVAAVSAIVQQCGRQILDRDLPVNIDVSGLPRKAALSVVARKTPPLIYALSLGAAHQGDSKNMVRALVNLGASLRIYDDGYGDYPFPACYDNALFYAAALGRADVLGEWLERYPDLAREDLNDDTLLHVACRHYQEDVVVLLLERGFYTAERNRDGQSPLNLAAGHMPVVNRVLAASAAETLRRLNRQATAPAAPEPEDAWRLSPNGDVTRTDRNVELTDVFNFQTMERKRHYRYADTGVERVETCAFAQLEPAAHGDVYAAWRALSRRGATQLTREELACALDPARPRVLVKRTS